MTSLARRIGVAQIDGCRLNLTDLQREILHCRFRNRKRNRADESWRIFEAINHRLNAPLSEIITACYAPKFKARKCTFTCS